jgi:hypothetical protein
MQNTWDGFDPALILWMKIALVKKGTRYVASNRGVDVATGTTSLNVRPPPIDG